MNQGPYPLGAEPQTVPVLLIAFNRPALLRNLICDLRQIRPSRVYLAFDGPRSDRPEEADLVAECISLVPDIDWVCEVRTLIQSSNLGCGLGVSTAISWFFENEDEGIILEDDIRPHPDFFEFCSELLDRYRDDERVFAITGCNFVPRPHIENRGDYRFSRLPHIWGWATWRRSWIQHELDSANWRSRLSLRDLWIGSGRSLMGSLHWANLFRRLAKRDIDTWDGQLVLAAFVAGQLTATPNDNLVENVGFNESATHTRSEPRNLLPAKGIRLPTAHCEVVADQRADEWSRVHQYGATAAGLSHKTVNRLLSRIRASY
jgi:hypothetical protein